MSANIAIKDWDYLTLLLRALDAVKNRKAFLLGAGTLLLATTFFAVGNLLAVKMSTGSPTSMFIMIGAVSILAILICWVGFSGVGLMLMDQAHDIESRSVMDALIGGLMSTGKFVMILFWMGYSGRCFSVPARCYCWRAKFPALAPFSMRLYIR